MSVGIVILAAGESARMGKPKQLLAYRGSTLLQHTIHVALAFKGAPVLVVFGANASKIRPQIEGARVVVVENPDWPEGMSGSIRVGLSALENAQPETSAAIFLVCDQPLVSAELLGDLVALQRSTGRAIAASEYGSTLGVPALFSRAMFPELLTLHGAGGARQVLHAHRHECVAVPFRGGSVDIDTPGEYRAFRKAFQVHAV